MATQEELILLMDRFRFSLEVARSLADSEVAQLLEVAQGAEDAYSGLRATDIVGDTRRLRIVSIDPVGGGEMSVVGEAWQDEAGVLHGSGIVAIMLFELASVVKYRSASVELDVSPLTILYSRIARSAFLRAEFVKDLDAAS
jgi:hypothetical protein